MINVMVDFERGAQEYKCGVQFMKNLLGKIEELGMLPPTYYSKKRIAIGEYEIHSVRDMWEPEEGDKNE